MGVPTVPMRSDDDAGWSLGGRKKNKRKTVTFGDASEVSTSILWAVGTLIVLGFTWWISTTVWESRLTNGRHLTALEQSVL